MNAPQEGAEGTRAKRGLLVYFAAVLLLSGGIEAHILISGGPISSHGTATLLLMWSPAFASLVARLALREGFDDVSFRFGGARTLRMVGLAWLYPVIVGFLGYGAAWLSRLAEFEAPKKLPFGLPTDPPALALFGSLALHLTLITLISAISATGEEIGWRGYMLTRLVRAKVKRPVLVSGLIWWAWHAPLILSGQYASGPHPVLSALLFGASIVASSYVAARVRLESGSVWPAVMFHSAWNAVIQGTFDGFTRGGDVSHTDNIFVGESGVMVVVAEILVALALTIRPFAVRITPTHEPEGALSMRSG